MWRLCLIHGRPTKCPTVSNRLGKSQRYSFLPAALSFEDKFHNLTRSASARQSSCGEVTDRLEFRRTIGHTNRKPRTLRQRDVWKIVAHVGYFFFSHSRFLQAFLKGSSLLCLAKIYESYL